MDKSAAGRLSEDRARDFLLAMGWEIVDRNFACKLGELDLVAKDGDTLVFVEVRSRSSTTFGSAKESVGGSKKHKLLRTALYYALKKGLEQSPMRFDVIGIDDDRLEHVVDAFWS